jgi:polyferredoxin
MRNPSSPSHKRHAWIIAVYLVLLALLIPWYWPEDDVRQVFGFPVWAVVSLGVLFIISAFTSWLCLHSEEPDE